MALTFFGFLLVALTNICHTVSQRAQLSNGLSQSQSHHRVGLKSGATESETDWTGLVWVLEKVEAVTRCNQKLDVKR